MVKFENDKLIIEIDVQHGRAVDKYLFLQKSLLVIVSSLDPTETGVGLEIQCIMNLLEEMRLDEAQIIKPVLKK